MREYGRVLRLSGTKGRLYELADAGCECEMNIGERIKACCIAYGAVLIGNMPSARIVAQHMSECATRNAHEP